MRYPSAIQNLIDKLAVLPSVGPKTAERYAFYLLNQNQTKLDELSSAIKEVRDRTLICHSCLNISETNPCPICADEKRITGALCIVENTQDLAAIEATKQFNGRYFILGGLINTIKETGPKDINVAKLIKKINEEKIKEIILALNFTLEGETTAMYLTKILQGKLKITRLAKGLPAGSDLEYADEITLASAFKNRSEMK